MNYVIYTDGATSFNGSSKSFGGWAYAVVDKDSLVFEDCGRSAPATNNQMELTAVVEAIEKIASISKEVNVDIYTDSAYIFNCFEAGWYINWQKNGWKNSKKEPVANKELWERILNHYSFPNKITFHKVKGHMTDKWNNYVDELAVKAKEGRA